MKTKKILSLILAVMMLVSVLSFTTSATNGYEDVTVNGLKMQFGDPSDTQYANTSPEQDMHLVGDTANNKVTVTYTGAITYYFPDELAFYITSGQSDVKSFSSDDGITVTPTIRNSDGSYTTTTNVKNGFYIVKLNTYNADSTSVTRSLTITKENDTTVTLDFVIPQTVTSSGSGVVSYLPAPGQLVNEGIGTGGWGEIHQNNSSAVKNMVDTVSGTGVSLGYYGGSIVLDLGKNGVEDSTDNPFGVDFIIYGNAFTNNAEPGCIQVAPDVNKDGIPDKWYSIAGSKYYTAETDTTLYYRDPTPTDNTGSTSTLESVPYSDTVTISGNAQTWTGGSTVTKNSFHNHSWFPLARNYFDGTERNATAYTGSSASGDMANLSRLTPATGSNPISVMENQTVNNGTATTVMSFSGRKLTWAGNGASNYTFGYADVHANGSSYGTAANPYAATNSSNGGDGIDIAWAVNEDGTPATNVTNIRFVRIYTGVAQMNGIFGEISTEVCGVYKTLANTVTNNSTTNGPTSVVFSKSGSSNNVEIDSTMMPSNGGTIAKITNIRYLAGSATELTVTVNSTTGSNVFVNDVKLTESSSGVFTGTVPTPLSGNKIRVLVQNGVLNPYLFVIT
jgi:hypothetical protein